MRSIRVVHRPLATGIDAQVHCRGVHFQSPEQPLLPLLGLPLLGELLSFLDCKVPLVLCHRGNSDQEIVKGVKQCLHESVEYAPLLRRWMEVEKGGIHLSVACLHAAQESLMHHLDSAPSTDETQLSVCGKQVVCGSLG